MANILQKLKSSLSPKTGKFFTSNILYNRSVLYFFLLVTVLDLYYLSATNDYLSVATFIITGILVSFFSTNMIVIMIIGLVVMHILKFGIKSTLNEGMETKKESETKEKSKEDDDVEEEFETSSNLEDKEKMIKEINKEMTEFDKLQKKILSGLNDITPLMDKAETFIEKMETKYVKKDK
jgi:hypothetical protein